jgi:predicted nuclease of predicted toxin-antitoxin system
MRFKLDENLPFEATDKLRAAGHDAQTVQQQNLAGKPDQAIAAVCLGEQRVILSLDLDFADVRSYPPHEHAGIIVFRLHSQDRDNLLAVIDRLLPLFQQESPEGKLWVVDEQAVRIRGE